MKIVVLSSLAWSLINFRGRLLAELVEAGHDVVACAPDRDDPVVKRLARMGVGFRKTPMRRAGVSPLADLGTLIGYWRLLRAERPDILIAYTQKPIIYGGIAARLAGVSEFYALMSGLGYVFSAQADHRVWLRRIVSRLYRAGVRKARAIFVFNGDDRRDMQANGIIGNDHYVVQVPGSGVDLDHFAARPLPPGPPRFVMIARLMYDKGVAEYVEAARIVRAQVPQACFQLIGRAEPDNPTGIAESDLAQWVASGLVEHLPETRDVRPHLANAHVFVLPSYYREGLPRTMLEAIATGRPVITTDMPGCREAVLPGETGWVVPPRDAVALAAAMLEAIQNAGALRTMGEAARHDAEQRFDVTRVNGMLLDVMRLGRGNRRIFSAAAPMRSVGRRAAGDANV